MAVFGRMCLPLFVWLTTTTTTCRYCCSAFVSRQIKHKTSQSPQFSSWIQGKSYSSFLAFSSSTRTSDGTEAEVKSSSASTSADQSATLLSGMELVQESVAQVLNELYDRKEIARQQAIAKLNKKSKKKKKKKNDDDNNDDTSQSLSDEEKEQIIAQAVAEAPDTFTLSDTAVTPATRSDFGDYQCNAAMGLSTTGNPRQTAQEIVNALFPKLQNVMKELEIAGPGFINFKYNDEYLVQAAKTMASDSQRLGIIKDDNLQKKVVVDYSSPNIAKEMHVGHLRSTIIGDTLCNVLEFVGHDVKRLNHIGDWGTQFGMLVEHLRDEYPEALQKDAKVDLGDLVLLYKAAKQRFDQDDDFKQRARQGVVKLQAGDEQAVAAWEALCAASRVEYENIYRLLNINPNLQERGESFYNPFLNDVVTDLEEMGLAKESDGATVVFLDGYYNRDGTPLPMLVRKSDGGFNYATTDLAAIRHRTTMEDGELAQRVLYVTDAGQSQHFEMVFQAAAKANFVPDTCSLEHVPFGLVQGEDGKKFATRSGETVKLKDLLNEAVLRASSDLKERNPDKADDDEFQKRIEQVSRIVGIGAVKYADLSMNRESNYRFSYERMLSMNGNTAPYMLYSYARICGIVRKASGQEDSVDGNLEWPQATEIVISHDSERELIRNLVKLPDVIKDVERDLYPNRICDYLFETSQKFNQFYENCSVNNAETPELKASRLSLCTATANTIRLLLTLLGIEVVEKL